jgi:hypothetical protein
MSQEQKDFSSISPSAKSLLMMKGYTDIPYAKQTAALMQGSEVFDLNFDDKDFWFWIRVMHFENRYCTIDQLLKQADNKNILELSSGYSLRGLDFCVKNKRLHYIDTDLPEIVALKQSMIADLQLDKDVEGTFELLPLNVMDESAFDNVVNTFDKQPWSIVNEGLLADDPDQKINLKAFHCEIVNKHDELKQEQGKYTPIPVIREVDDRMVQKNYLQVKQEVEQLVQTEMDRVIDLPGLGIQVVKKG